MQSQKKIGLALGSGGVRGLAHIGVIKSLVRHRVPIDLIAGSSIGAWVGAYYALFQDIEMLEKFTIENKADQLDAFLEISLDGGLIDGEKTKEILTQWLGNALIEHTKIPFASVATDVNTRETCVFLSDAIVPAIQASMAIPGVFKPILHQGHLLVDGAISNPVPSDVVRDMGADIVIAVNLYRLSKYPRDELRVDLGLFDIARKSIDIVCSQLAKNSMRSAHIVIEPDVERYDGLIHYFMHDEGQDIIKIGERETEKIIPQLKQLLSKSASKPS